MRSAIVANAAGLLSKIVTGRLRLMCAAAISAPMVPAPMIPTDRIGRASADLPAKPASCRFQATIARTFSNARALSVVIFGKLSKENMVECPW